MISFMFFSISEHNRKFINCLRALPVLLIFMMIFRGITFWLSSGDTDPGFNLKSGLWITFAGLRFDLLVMGFVYLPIYFMCWFLHEKWQAMYLNFFWFVIVLMNFTNLHFFLKNNGHRHWIDHKAMTYFDDMSYWWKHESRLTSVLLIFIYILIFSIGRRSIIDHLLPEKKNLGVDLDATPEEDDPRRRFEAPIRNAAKALWPLFLVAFMARGSFTQHHLRREDSFVTQSSALNEIVLNPIWTLDKVRP